MSTLLDGTPAPQRAAGPPRSPRPASRRPSWRLQVLLGVSAALRAGAFALLPLAVVVLVGWAGAGGGDSSAADALRVTVYGWLLGHGVDIGLARGGLRLAPLGLTLLPLGTVTVAATQAVRSSLARTPRQAAVTVVSLVLAHTALLVVAAAATSTPAARPSWPGAVVGGLLLGGLATCLGTARVLRRRPGGLPAMPETPGVVLAGGVAALAALVAGAALLVAVSLAVHAPEAAASARSLHAGPLGGVLLLGLCALLLPNAVVCAAAYALGPGFAVGTGTSVAPSGVVLGPLPDLPLLVALPGAGAAPTVSLLALGLPVLAGAAAGVVVARRCPPSTGADRAAGLAGLSGLGAGLALGLLCLLAGGAVGAGTLSRIGPAVLPVTLAAVTELGLVAAAVAWVLVHRARTRSR